MFYFGEYVLMYWEFWDFVDFMVIDLFMNFDGGECGYYYFNFIGMFEMWVFVIDGSVLKL